MEFDLIVSNGTVVDGTGRPRFRAEVGIRDGQIAAIASGEPLSDWRPYEAFVYDVWPQVNASARDQAPDLYWYKLYNACGGSPVTKGGPPLALDQWNHASVSLNPLDSCWGADGLNPVNGHPTP